MTRQKYFLYPFQIERLIGYLVVLCKIWEAVRLQMKSENSSLIKKFSVLSFLLVVGELRLLLVQSYITKAYSRIPYN